MTAFATGFTIFCAWAIALVSALFMGDGTLAAELCFGFICLTVLLLAGKAWMEARR